MRITAIAREDLSNIGNGLVPNKITLELSGKIVPDSYGEHIGRYDIAESSKNEPTEIENGIDRGYCINGNYKCRYELLFAANGLTSRVVIEYRTNNMPMYDLIKDIEDDIREALEDDSDEDNFFCGIIKNSEICMFDEFGCGIGVEINNADELTAMLASARLLSCEFEEKDGSDGR